MKLAVKAAACLLAGCCIAGNFSVGEAAYRHASDTVSETTSNVHEETRGVVEGTSTSKVKRESVSSLDRLQAESRKAADAAAQKSVRPNMQTMRMWDVQATDTGGTLLFSDSPEYVNQDGILYSDTVQGDARILFYHLNNTSEQKKVAVILENQSGSYSIVHVTRGGMSQPSSNYLAVGKRTQVEYFDTKLNDVIYVRNGGKRLLQNEMNNTVLEPGQLVYGVFDFSSSTPVKVSVIMYGADVDPYSFIEYARVLPKDAQRLRGTFKGMDRIIRSQKAYDPRKDGIVYFPIGDNERDTYRTGVDATDGSLVTNYGNYGVLYRIEIPTAGNDSTRYYLSPLGGTYAGAMTVDFGRGQSNLLLTPNGRTYFGDATPAESDGAMQAREAGTAVLTHTTELADLGTYKNESQLSFEYSPPGASNLPVNIILMPAK